MMPALGGLPDRTIIISINSGQVPEPALFIDKQCRVILNRRVKGGIKKYLSTKFTKWVTQSALRYVVLCVFCIERRIFVVKGCHFEEVYHHEAHGALSLSLLIINKEFF